ncbi:MAG: hypothetical protein LQ345_003291 [Seirophora villosa]|nr:MAG: hypothetical protein LQ345_003291 [Seirophora villosa]
MITDNNTLYERETSTRGAKIRANKTLSGRELAARDQKVKRLQQTKKRLLARISELDADKADEDQPIGTGPLGLLPCRPVLLLSRNLLLCHLVLLLSRRLLPSRLVLLLSRCLLLLSLTLPSRIGQARPRTLYTIAVERSYDHYLRAVSTKRMRPVMSGSTGIAVSRRGRASPGKRSFQQDPRRPPRRLHPSPPNRQVQPACVPAQVRYRISCRYALSFRRLTANLQHQDFDFTQ